MGERCRCGAELQPHLHFCVGCGADRQAAAPSGAYPVPTNRAEPAPTLHGGPVPGWPPAGAPMWQPPRPPEWPQQGPPEWQQQPGPSWQPTPTSWEPGPPAWEQPAPTSSPAPWLIALSVLVVLLLSASAVLVTLRPELVGLGSDPVVAPAAAEPTGPSSASGAPRSTPALSGREELAAQVDRDRSRVEPRAGSWVPQLSSKKPGTVDSGVTYDDEKILSHYRGLAAQYPGTALLWSGDWPVFKGDDYWVVISAQSFPTAAAANAWCDAQGFGRDDCLAKNLSRTGGPDGTTVSR